MVVFQHGEDHVQHLVGHMSEGDEVVLAALHVTFVDLGEQGIMTLEDGDLGGPHHGGAQVPAASL